MKKIIIAATVLFCLGASATVYAGRWPTGQWKATAYDDQSGNSLVGTEDICIEPGGTWFGTSFSWGGHWFKKGNDLHLRGNWENGTGNVGFEATKVAGWHMDSYYQQWRDDHSDEEWFTLKWQKKSNQCDPPAAQVSDPEARPFAAE